MAYTVTLVLQYYFLRMYALTESVYCTFNLTCEDLAYIGSNPATIFTCYVILWHDKFYAFVFLAENENYYYNYSYIKSSGH